MVSDKRTIITRLGVTLCLIFNVILSNAYSAEKVPTSNSNSGFINFLALADIHFDPFIACGNVYPCPLIEKLRRSPSTQWSNIFSKYDIKPPQFRQDTNYPLLKSSLNAAKQAASINDAQFVIVLGDSLGHKFPSRYKQYSGDKTGNGYQSFVRKTLEFVTGEAAAAFPLLDVYTIVGNNDSYQGDYVTNANGQFFSDTAIIWSSLIRNTNNRLTMQKQFQHAGYYSITVPSLTNLRLIFLNTNLFSYKAKGKNLDANALEELNWLHTQLLNAKQARQKVLISMHIPEGIDVYATSTVRLFRLISLWKPQYEQRFHTELDQFSPEIAGIFTGHLHTDWFQILTTTDSHAIPVTGVPSISPIFGNNPGFKTMSYSINPIQLNDYVTYYYSLSGPKIWNKAYDFKLTKQIAQ